ncbi:hypothetical protein bAD24_p00820 (plasmid) [Burkholderia sp. AD24]|nr:hypothetical protein bAD24_p00820 [Burkholderia sp. AD24]
MKTISRWHALGLLAVLAPAYGQTSVSCVSAQQHAATEARIASLTQNIDVGQLGRDLEQAEDDQKIALDAVQDCQKPATFGMGCGKEIDAYNLAEERYKIFSQRVEMFRAMTTAQANARALKAPVCP